MTEKHTSNEMNKALFTNLVIMLSSSAMQQMGKLVNPLTNKTEVNLQGAQISIDMLAMLQAKTKGNLDKDEDKMLNDVLSSLQMNYVETARSEVRGQKSAASATQAPPEATPRREASAFAEASADKLASHGKTQDSGKAENRGTKEEAGGKAEGGDSKKKDPKFHKSYGE